MEELLMTKNLAQENSFMPHAKATATRANWMFEVEPYSRSHGESLQNLRDNLRLKKAMKRAVEQDVAPLSLIEAVRAGIRA
jgi:hypothetical protein